MKLSKRAHLLNLLCCWAMLALLSPTSLAADAKSASEKADVTYEMKQGDTLLALVAKYFSNESALAEVTRINQIKNPYKIPVGQKLTFPRELLLFTPSQAHITTLECAEPVLIAGDNKSLRLGDVIAQGALIKVPKGCEAGMTLEDASVVSLLPGTLVRIKTLRKTPLEKSPEVELELLGGRIELDVPKRQAGDAPYQVRTPSSLAGVRGTKFRVAFDADQRNSQVEVNHGNVAAKGNADKIEQSVRDNMGVAINAAGLAGSVEYLPLPPFYTGFEGRATAAKLKFGAPIAGFKYLVSKSTNANFVGRVGDELVQAPELDAQSLSTQATFYQWASLTKSGLLGASQQYGFCAVGDLKTSKCNVNFNMRGIATLNIRLQRLDRESNALEDVINSTLNIDKNDQLLFKDLPVGHYQWDVTYVIDAGVNVHKAGEFDLVAIPAK